MESDKLDHIGIDVGGCLDEIDTSNFHGFSVRLVILTGGLSVECLSDLRV